MDSTGRAAGWGEILAPQHLAALVLVCLGPWLHAADALLVTTMMPAIVARIGGVRLVAWNFALYEVGSIVAGASAGLVALRYGLRLPMVAITTTIRSCSGWSRVTRRWRSRAT